ncbi:hypothetical protein [Rossellomorea sp. DA94]|uniref:hypothetical protein n=1 Tax=Rossellomorea sp. DA94 TaxID=3038653 RepID=UPI00244C27BB|nr:hypothetical protein [Rossellomorea sp. DA94]WGG47671.1 hypothetical protein P8596_10875 [Rossellomorea sp. DA94]
MRRYRGGFFLVGSIILVTWMLFPFIIGAITTPLQLIVNYAEFGHDKFGFQNRTLMMYLWVFWPLIIIYLLALRSSRKDKIRKQNANN